MYIYTQGGPKTEITLLDCLCRSLKKIDTYQDSRNVFFRIHL